jgi:hypothetical protein
MEDNGESTAGSEEYFQSYEDLDVITFVFIGSSICIYIYVYSGSSSYASGSSTNKCL